tara:strand:+ start:936 stop:1214 length:279 start_codon:yes stop_codon:yes gene_type:complete
MNKKQISARDAMLHICKTIWTSRTEEHIEGCENMLENYKKTHGDQNIGITLIELELARQRRLNKLFKSMGKVQQALKDTKGKQLDYKLGKIK